MEYRDLQQARDWHPASQYTFMSKHHGKIVVVLPHSADDFAARPGFFLEEWPGLYQARNPECRELIEVAGVRLVPHGLYCVSVSSMHDQEAIDKWHQEEVARLTAEFRRRP